MPLVLKFKGIPYHGNLEGYLADVFENIFSKEPCQATSAKQRSATVNNSTIKHPKSPVPFKAHILLQTLDSLTVMGRFRRYCPERAISISS